MNNESGKAFKFIFVFFAFVVTAIVVQGIFLSQANRMREFVMWMGIISVIVSIARPRIGLVIAMISTAYIDLMKRFMVLDYRVSYTDLYYVLGFTPIVLLGVCVGAFVEKILKQQFTNRDGVFVVFGSLVFLGVGGAIGLGTSGGMVAKLAAVAQSASYAVMIFLVPFLMPSIEEKIAFLKKIVLVFIPVALYSLYQFFFDLSDFEYAYLETGLSGEARHLGRGLGEKDYRLNFSTLNSTVSVSTITSIFCAMLLYRFKRSGHSARERFSYLMNPVLVCPIFAGAAISTLTRSGWLAGLVAVTAMICFRFKMLTLLCYLVGGAVFGSLILFPHAWEDRLRKGLIQSDSEVGHLAARTQTWTARTIGFVNLKEDKKLWTPFGIERGKSKLDSLEWQKLTHDSFTYMLMKYGFIPVGFGCVFLLVGMFLIHRKYFKLQDENNQRMYLMSLSLVAGLGVTTATNTNALAIFPINFYLWLFIGIMMSHFGVESVLRQGRKKGVIEADSLPRMAFNH